MSTHKLKTDPQVFDDVAHERKLFEVRYDDRHYRVGDTLILCKTKHTADEMRDSGAPLIFTGDEIWAEVTYKLKGYGLQPGWCVLGIKTRMIKVA